MAKLTIHEAPTDAPKPTPVSLAEQIKADATRIEREKDAIGRMIGVKKLNFLDTHQITCMLSDDASNGTALNQAMMAASVVEIDGDPVSRPRSRAQLEALMGRLDFHGVSAAIVAMGRFSAIGVENEAEETKN